MTERDAVRARRRPRAGDEAQRRRARRPAGRASAGSRSASRCWSARSRWTGSRSQDINPYTVPGLLPGLLGIAMIAARRACSACAAGGAAALRARRRAAMRSIARERSASGRARAVPRLRRGPGRPRPAVLARRRDLRHGVDPHAAAPQPRPAERAARSRERRRSRSLIGLGAGVCSSPSSCSRSCSWCACPERVPRHHAARTRRPRPRLARLPEPDVARSTGSAAPCSASSSACLPGLSATLVHRAADDADDQAAGQRRDPGADLLVRRRALRRLAHRDPAEHPGTAANAASCADGYALAQQGEAGRAIGIATSGAFIGTLFGVLCLGAVHADAGRGRAVVRRLRVLLARAVRRRRCRAASSATIRSRAG